MTRSAGPISTMRPACMTAMRWLICAATRKSCVIIRMARPSSFCSLRSNPRIWVCEEATGGAQLSALASELHRFNRGRQVDVALCRRIQHEARRPGVRRQEPPRSNEGRRHRGRRIRHRWGIYYNAGETCHAGSRVIVHQSVKDALIEAVGRVAATIPLGHPFEPATQMGALIDQGHMQRVLGYIDSGISQGARVALGGKRAFEEYGGYYVEATVLDNVRADMRVAREEIFGPVLTMTSFADEAEAIRLANDTTYG